MSNDNRRRRIRQVDDHGTSIVSCAREVDGFGVRVEGAIERAVERWGAEEGEGADGSRVRGEVLQRKSCGMGRELGHVVSPEKRRTNLILRLSVAPSRRPRWRCDLWFEREHASDAGRTKALTVTTSSGDRLMASPSERIAPRVGKSELEDRFGLDCWSAKA